MALGIKFGWRTAAGIGLAASAMLLSVACASDEDEATATPAAGGGAASTATMAPAPEGLDYESLSGTVSVDGSSTVFPISEAVAEEFSKVARGVRANVAFSGTGGGFEKFCRGEIDISDASRPIKDSEVDACKANGITDIVEIQVAIDALTVMVHPDNDWAACMTVEEANLAFKAGGATNWSDIRAEWPNESIKFYYPGTDSGTFDYFVEAIIDEVEGSDHRGDGTASEDDNILAQGIENDRYALGYFGFAYFLEAGQALKAVAIDGGDGCVDPSFDAALDGSYQPLARPLFIYTRESLLADKPEVLGFVNFYVENMQALVPDVGYVTLPENLHQEQMAKVTPFLP
ncbi:MAG: PstS family phosphate ABC transporter substrate-binding protein [Dehalococcoidia bacterium]|nr:PstS family phosphate ABC transporter substrate-binding protein [Dehalococcoidia bacterium]